MSEEGQVPGFFFKNHIDFVKEKKGPEGVVKMQALVPNFDFSKLSLVRKYTIQEEILVLKAVALVVYGNELGDSWEKLGRHDCDTIFKSSIGKILFSLVAKTQADFVKKGGQLFSAMAPFIVYSYDNLNEHGVDITLKNDPYPIEYYRGLFLSLLESFKLTSTIASEDRGNGVHIYHTKW